MWSRFLELFGRGYQHRPGARAARSAVETKYPEADVYDVWLRARESDRDVVAVLYRDRSHPMMRGMPLYKLLVVRRDLTTEELPVDTTSSPYLIRGIK